MADKFTSPDDLAIDLDGAAPLSRFRDARWLLLVGAVLGAVATLFYGVPVLASVSGVAILAAVAAFVPRRSRSMKLQAGQRRQLRRMWPGTGMKVTVDALPVPCFVADGRGITRYVNAAAIDYYGQVKPGDPLSFSLRAPSLLEAFDRVSATGEPERIHWQEKVPTEAFFEAHVAPVYMPGSAAADNRPATPDFILVVINDQTEQKRLERMRTDFVANASHELRTPLASLTGFVETLQGPAKDDPEARDRFLKIMLEQAGRMRRLIDDILSLSRIELKAHVRPAASVDLIEIVRHTADALAPLARDLGMTIRTEVEVDEAIVRGDRDELIQVAENLVENALKYGGDGEFVDIRIQRTKNGDAADHICLAVQDYGAGIASEHVPRLTERFYRVDVGSSRAMKGTGLGLAIVKHILARHRARLEIESVPGKGSTFTVHFMPSESA